MRKITQIRVWVNFREESSMTVTEKKVLRIYTDGACSGNQNDENIGGWGAILEYGQHQKELCGGEVNTTNNRMEMTGLLQALRARKKPGQTIEVFCDSSYLMDCFRQKWYERWVKNGWMTSSKKPVENRELWEALLPFLDEHDISFYRVKGHVNVDWHMGLTKKKSETDISSNDDPQSAFSEPADEIGVPDDYLWKTYRKFCEWNGNKFLFEQFVYITRMNNHADRLANEGMDQFR